MSNLRPHQACKDDKPLQTLQIEFLNFEEVKPYANVPLISGNDLINLIYNRPAVNAVRRRGLFCPLLLMHAANHIIMGENGRQS